jgi:hypothetical protein
MVVQQLSVVLVVSEQVQQFMVQVVREQTAEPVVQCMREVLWDIPQVLLKLDRIRRPHLC